MRAATLPKIDEFNRLPREGAARGASQTGHASGAVNAKAPVSPRWSRPGARARYAL